MGTTARAITLTALAAAVGAVAWAVQDLPAQLGGKPSGGRDERMRRSPQFRDGKFRNQVPNSEIPPDAMRAALRELAFGKQRRRPSGTIPVVTPDGLDRPLPPEGLNIIWYGHSTAMAEIEGRRVLFDPVWSDRCSPSPLVGPRRMHPMPLPVFRTTTTTTWTCPPYASCCTRSRHPSWCRWGSVRTWTGGGYRPSG